jgi:hypothetical protein
MSNLVDHFSKNMTFFLYFLFMFLNVQSGSKIERKNPEKFVREGDIDILIYLIKLNTALEIARQMTANSNYINMRNQSLYTYHPKILFI